MLLLVYAHPYPDRSRANRRMLSAARSLDGVEIRSLYDLYPDFAVDVDAEQDALSRADVVVWQHPMYWYGPPAALKHYFDKVLAHGWAYGPGGDALAGKTCLWAVTTGGDEASFSEAGMHAHAFDAFVPPMRQTAQFCQMRWREPFVLHGARRMSDGALAEHVHRYRDLLAELTALTPPRAKRRDGGDDE